MDYSFRDSLNPKAKQLYKSIFLQNSCGNLYFQSPLIIEAKTLFCLGFGTKMFQGLIHILLMNLVLIIMQILSNLQFRLLCTALFWEFMELELKQICNKGAVLKIKIFKGISNHFRKLLRCFIHPNYLEFLGKICPVALIDLGLIHCIKLGHNSVND